MIIQKGACIGRDDMDELSAGRSIAAIGDLYKGRSASDRPQAKDVFGVDRGFGCESG
ncbi:hypothetical protein GCM10011309_14960 [Litorimonas cladophorae]|uniref:Uncharacterized protein n=1 Tax=Litorimonas cladophorae TaxID=1220491 RepID=A0A918NGG9_9PROT|nr:hypothetical protein GCM10011309_14960 [Litorimonas cladophorae]